MAGAAKLSATDRKQLCKITDGRFDILSQQLTQRYSEVVQDVRREVIAEHEQDIKNTRRDLDLIQEARQKADARLQKIVAQANAEHNEEIGSLDLKRNHIVSTANDNGLDVNFDRYTTNSYKVIPKNVDKIVKGKTFDFDNQYSTARRGLKTKQLNILESISVAGLESDEAKDFLGEIPNVDQLLPSSAEEAKQLEPSNRA